MHDWQVYMIFQNAKKPGGRLDENLRKTLIDICSTREGKERVKSLEPWQVYEMYQQLENDIPPSNSVDYLPPIKSYHQVTFEEIGVNKDG